MPAENSGIGLRTVIGGFCGEVLRATSINSVFFFRKSRRSQ
jgi:hypothetical protein